MKIDPLHDSRWPQFLARHPQASVFHSPEWLAALRRTYGYEPVVFTTSPPGQPLENGIVFCRVHSWLTGARLVSVPFADHCQPLAERPEDTSQLYRELECEMSREKYRYVELRPLVVNGFGSAGASRSDGRYLSDPRLSFGDKQAVAQPLCFSESAAFVSADSRTSDSAVVAVSSHNGSSSQRERRSSIANRVRDAVCLPKRGNEFYFHKLDLRPDLDTLFGKLHKSCVRKKIRRAEQERLEYEAGRSESMLEKFYYLLLLTRRRHGLPPQPMRWFRNLINCFGERLAIRLVSKDRRPIASILTLLYKNTLVYKYGCSDARFHKLGGMPLLFWKAIEEAKAQGTSELDLGRSDLDNPGLSTFKEHLGAACSRLTYLRLGTRGVERAMGGRSRCGDTLAGLSMLAPGVRMMRAAFTHLPDPVIQMAGTVLYRHTG
jgi:hypothetical protein